MHFTISFMPHTGKIILHCLLVTTPMLASSLVILYIVYTNLAASSCPLEELCPGSDLVNATPKDTLFINFPAARLAFISSWSSTVSFALISFLMALSAYLNAAELLRASESGDQELLPSPHQMSLLLRVLNAELIVLWDLAVSQIKRVFWKREKDTGRKSPVGPVPQASPILRTSIMILLSGIVASLMVQAADVYFHIAAEAVELVQVHELPSEAHHYSRGLASWCLDRPNEGPLGPKKFWGCAITAQAALYNNATSIAPTNATMLQDLKNSVSDQHQVLNFTDSNSMLYAVIAPANVDTSQDWKASSFGVSTTCSAITENACETSEPISNASDGQGSPLMLIPFACTKNRTGIDILGNLTSHDTKTHMLDFHKYAAESSPFRTNTMETPPESAIRATIQDENADGIFKNPWQALVMRKIPFALQGDFEALPPSFRNDSRVWKHNQLGAFTLMLCNITVWDITYIASGGKVTHLTKFPSNGSTAGIASMPGTRFMGALANVFQDESTGPDSRSSPSAFIRSFELGMSKAYSYPLASQLSSRPSLLTQVRISKVVTKLPVAALWFLVAANLGFAVLGAYLAICAMSRATPVVHQVQMRLGVSGLAAALFDRERFERNADADDKLFEEKNTDSMAVVNRIGITRTDTGGSSFAVYSPRSRREEEQAMQRQYFGSIARYTSRSTS